MKGFEMKVEYGKLSSQFLIAALLATGTGTGYLNYHQPVILADSASDSLEITQTQAVNFIDQQSGKVVGSQQLVLQKNGKTFASDTKLKLPSGYKRADKFTYDLSGGDSKDSHYTVAKDGKITWNVYVSKDSDQQESGSNAKTITSTNTTHNDDGTDTITTTVTTTTGSKNSIKTSSVDSTSASSGSSILEPNGDDSTSSDTNEDASQPSLISNQTKASVSSSQAAVTSNAAKLLDPNGSSATPSSTQVSEAKSTHPSATSGSSSAASSTTNANSNNNESATSSASILEPNGSSASNTSATSSSPATSSANVGATSGSSSAANSSSSTPTSSSASTDNVSNNGQNSQTLPQTSADQATPAAEEAIGLGLAGVLAGIGLGHVIVKHHGRRKNE